MSLADHAEEVVRRLLGAPNQKLSSTDQLRYGSHGSLAIEINGDKAGQWYDHEAGTGGGLLSLIQRERNCDRASALGWLNDEFGLEPEQGNGAGEQQRRTAVYVYENALGDPLYCVSRWGPLKAFTQERYDPETGKFIPGRGTMDGVKLVPYRLEEWCDEDGRVFVVEGEKDADRLAGLGLRATTNPGGAGKWPKSFAPYFTDRDVIVIPDNDQAGRDHARDVVAHQKTVGNSLRILELPALLPKQDVSEWLDHGRGLEHLETLLQGERTSGAERDAKSEAKAARTAVDGAALLDDVRAFLARFVSYPSAEAGVAHVLWIAHTHLMDAWDSTPRLAFLSPEPASGKTRALEVTELLVPRPVEAVNISPAYLFRKVVDDDGAPTILFDEIDTVFGPKARDNEEIRGLLNAGHRRGAKTGRCVVRGKIVETEEIPAYCAVALAGLGWLPDTLMTRAVVIRMRPRAPGEQITPYRRRLYASEGAALHRRIDRWAADALEVVTGAWPEMPAGIEDRDADVWESLLAVADAAGGDWPRLSRAAAVALVTESRDNTPSLGVRLLADLRTIFGDRDAMRTNDILIALHALEEAPWADLKGKPLNPRGLATRLRQYGISRRKVRFGQETAWGYVRSDFADAWTRYLIPEAPESGTSGTSGIDTPEAAATADPNVPDRVPDCADVPDSELQRERRRARESANVPDVPDVPDLSAYGRSYLAGAADGADCNRVTDVTDPGPAYERCAVCDGNVVDRLEEDGLVGHPSCIIAARSWPEAARATLRRCAKHSK